MFDNSDGQYGNKSLPFMQRSAGAPASEHEAQLGVDSSMYGYNNTVPRNTVRMPRNGAGNGNNSNSAEENNIGSLLEETSGLGLEDKNIISSLITDPKNNRTPLDLLQQDFPSASSPLYTNNRLFPGSQQDQDGSNNATKDQQQQQQSLDSAMQNLYVSGGGGDDDHNNNNNANNNNPQARQQQQGGAGGQGREGGGAQGQYGRGGRGAGGNPNNIPPSYMQQQGGPGGELQQQGVPVAMDPPAGGGVGGQQQQGGQNPNQQQQLPYGRGQQMPPQHQVQYMPVDQQQSPQQQGGAGVVQPGGNQLQQTTYYLQQPMYLDQNGQPMYYRVGPNGQPYQDQQQMMYAPQNPDGTTNEAAAMMAAAYNPYGQMNGQQMPGQGYWPGQQGPGGEGVNGGVSVGGYPVGNNQGGGVDPSAMQGGGGGMRRGGGGMYGGGQQGGPQQQYMNMGPGGGRGGGGYGNNNPNMERRVMQGGGGDINLMREDKRGGGQGGEYRERGDARSNRNMGGGGPGGLNTGGNRNDSYGRMNSSVNPMRDPLVDEFRSTYGKSRQWELVDLLGHVVAFCQDQHGSRFIQQRLEVCPDVDKQLIFDEIIPSAHSLMTDVFGNYVLQKLFEYGTPDQCETLALLLTGQSVQLSMQMYGCRVVQKALEYVSTQRLIALVSEFENSQVLLRCVHDSNGNHVIQKCIEIVSKVAKEASTPELSEYLSSRIMFIINSFQGRVKELSSHPYGCRVVQRILEHCSNPQKAVILEELRKCCAELVQDCYGNYVIQFVMQHGWEADRAVLIKEVQAHLLDFSQHKFASNVVEKCLQYASKRDRDEMIWTIINVTFDLNNPVDAKTGHCVLESMVRDPYANYVVQKVIDVSDERQRAAIMRYVRENIVQLRRYTYGKHIIVRLEKITNEKF